MSSVRPRQRYSIAAISILVRLLSALAVLACLGEMTSCSFLDPSARSSSARILLSPTSASVSSQSQLQFTAVIENSSHTAVNWSVTAGTIEANGLFYAPKVTIPQTVIVSVENMDRPKSSARASVLVTPTEGLSIATQDLPAAISGISYFQQLSQNGGAAPFSWSISSGALPQGMQLQATSGVISGTTGKLGTYPFTVSVKDASSSQVNQVLALTVSADSAAACGPPAYLCAVSTNPSTVVQLPATLPKWTAGTGPNAGNPLYGAGVSATTNEFGSPTTIFRLTDLSTNCSPNASTLYSSGQVANSGSGDETHFNVNSTLVVIGSTGDWICPESVNTANGQLSFSRIDNNFYFPGTVNSVVPSFSANTPNLMYVQNGSQIQSYDFTGYGPTATAPGPTDEYDFASANCLFKTATPYRITWGDHLTSAKYPPDSMFGEAFSNAGIQNTGFDVVAYKPGSGCSHYNTKTGIISGDWGTTGPISIPDRFLVHNAIVSKDGVWMIITYESCLRNCSAPVDTTYYWLIGTNTVMAACPPTGGKCAGHWTEGVKHQINTSGDETYQEEIRTFAGAPSSPTDTKAGIAACSSGGWGTHLGWANVDALDSYPYYETTVSSTETGLPGSHLSCPFEHEIDLVSPAGVGSNLPSAGTVYREAHTFNSGKQTSLFSCQYAIGAVSTDGTIAIWESDGEGAFGSVTGGSHCSGTSCRCEVVGMLLQ
jgi:Putative Ig domain